MAAKVPDAIVAATALLLVEGARTWREWTPDLTDVRRAQSGDVTIIADTRAGEVAAGIVVLGIGGALSYMSGSIYPVAAGVLVVVALSIITERHLRATPVETAHLAAMAGIDQLSELPGLAANPFE
jgi:alcohol dehydrogenase class IV